ncbi:MAG TPA: hypothetical protein VHA10_21145, partial [Hypericibacter adhaerens]|uniref:hypothetical protein n=1 Tax=Hypericibacter adhaerens TaxID=2602016 RepID=UPI002B86D5E3
ELVGSIDRVVSRDMSLARNRVRELVGGAITLRPTRDGGLDAVVTGDYSGLVALAARDGSKRQNKSGIGRG